MIIRCVVWLSPLGACSRRVVFCRVGPSGVEVHTWVFGTGLY
jgi:hypothetical protein